MKKSRRLFCCAVGIPVLLGAVATLFVNLFIQSARIQLRLTSEMERQTGLPVRMTFASFLPWKGVTLQGLVIDPTPDLKNSIPFFRAESFTTSFSLLDAMRGSLTVREFTLSQPVLVWRQSPNGHWEMPVAPLPEPEVLAMEPPHTVPGDERPQPVPPKEVPAESPPPTKGSPSTAGPIPLPPADRSSETKEFRFNADSADFRVRDGELHFLDPASSGILRLRKVQVHSSFGEGKILNGKLSSAQVDILDSLPLHKLETGFQRTPTHVECSEGKAMLGGGEITFDGSVDFLPGDTIFRVKSAFHGIDLAEVARERGTTRQNFGGHLDGAFEISGSTGPKANRGGGGSVHLKNGYIRDHPILSPLGTALNIKELVNIEFENGQASFVIDGDMLSLSELTLASKHIWLSATGQMSTEGNIRLDARLHLDDSLASQLPSSLRKSFKKEEAPATGGIYLPFSVVGTLQEPRTDILDRLMSHSLSKEVKGLMNTFMPHGSAAPAPTP